MNYGLNSTNGQMNNAAYQVPKPNPQPMLFQEAEMLAGSIEALESELGWLIGRIAPVCQTSPPRAVSETSGAQIKQSPSEFRARLMEHRQRIDNMFARIADLKHTIEL
jgi:hypothetical protein